MSLQNTRHKIFNTFKNAPKTCVYSLMLFIAAIIILCGNDATNAYPIICAFSAFFFFCGLLYFFSGKAIFALSASSVFVIVLQFVNQLKIHHYKQRLMFADLYIMFDPSNTKTLLHYPINRTSLRRLIIINDNHNHCQLASGAPSDGLFFANNRILYDVDKWFGVNTLYHSLSACLEEYAMG